MRKSDENSAEASLELLLDTICNSFGGILFLTILMALLLKVSSPKVAMTEVSQAAKHELLEQEMRLQEALATLDSLRETLSVQGKTYERLVEPEIAEKYHELQLQEKRRDDLKRALFELGRKSATVQVAIDQAAEQREKVKSDAARLAQAVQSRRRELEDTVRRQTKTVHPSRTRSTTKLNIALVLRYDRLYVVFDEGRGGLLRSLNQDDFLIVKNEDGADVATPKPYRGIPIEEGPQLRGAVARILSGCSPDTYYIDLAVWEDSFDSFAPLRDACVDAGFEYRIIPFEADEVLHFGQVNDPQVQ